MTHEQKLDALSAFFDKYEELIDDAKENSDLWALKELDLCLGGEMHDKKTEEHIVNAMLFLAERFNDEYEMSPEGLKAWCDSVSIEEN